MPVGLSTDDPEPCPRSPVEPLLAALPILAVVVLMIGRGWAAWKAGVVSAALAVGLAVGVFSLGADLDGGAAAGFGASAAEASFTAAVIMWIIGPALAIHHLQVATGATTVLRGALGRLSDDPRVLALLIGWFFALFAEGASAGRAARCRR